MTTNTNQVSIWLKEFQYTWLPQHISNNTRLLKLITNKLHELEQLLNQNNQNEVILEDEYPYSQSNNTELVVLSSQPEHVLLTPPNIQNHVDEKSYRPAIRLKRIPLNEAEQFLPTSWIITKSKRGRKKRSKKLRKINSPGKRNKKTTPINKVPLSSPQDKTPPVPQRFTRSKLTPQQPSTSSLTSIQTISDNKKKSKRKLRAIDAEDDDLFILGNLSQTENPNGNTDCDQISRYIGQNGILSQTRKSTQTTNDDDFTIRLQSRNSNRNKTLLLSSETLLSDPIAISDDVNLIDDEQSFQEMIANHDTESLFASLDIPFDKTVETTTILNNNSMMNYNDCIEDISNDGMDPPTSTSSPTIGQFSLTT